MQFIAVATRGGCRPTSAEVLEWCARPGQLRGQRGRLLEPARPGLLGRSMNGATGQAMVRSAVATITSLTGTPPKYEMGPPESITASLLRLQWAREETNGGLQLTALGRALLRADVAEEENDVADVVVLEANDALAYGRIVGHIADSGPAFIIDPYLRAADLMCLLQHTSTRRVLIGSKLSKSDVAELRVLLTSWTTDSEVELRQAPVGVLHDRLIVGEIGVHMVGTSLNGVGKGTTTLLIPLPEEVADQMRETAESWWSASASLGRSQSVPAVSVGAHPSSEN